MHSFSVSIAAPCSGLEGMGLMLVFGIGWLWLFRRECRFPQALLLLPAGLMTVWASNVLRIALLIVIGGLGAPDVAVRGFHSQAGWIAFNAVALGFSLAAGRIQWVRKTSFPKELRETRVNPTAAYLMPFLAILAASMIARSLSSQFEWLYPLRFIAAMGALWYFRNEYRTLDWRTGVAGPAVGILVFVMWIGMDHWRPTPVDNGTAGILSGLVPWARFSWLGLRTLAAVVTVPIAEELAFRGFLIRRFLSAQFDTLHPKTYQISGVLISSLIFGMLHGDRWLAGTLAGLLYAWVFLRRGRIGDAVAAHATTNALIALLVLSAGRFDLW